MTWEMFPSRGLYHGRRAATEFFSSFVCMRLFRMIEMTSDARQTWNTPNTLVSLPFFEIRISTQFQRICYGLCVRLRKWASKFLMSVHLAMTVCFGRIWVTFARFSLRSLKGSICANFRHNCDFAHKWMGWRIIKFLGAVMSSLALDKSLQDSKTAPKIQWNVATYILFSIVSRRHSVVDYHSIWE